MADHDSPSAWSLSQTPARPFDLDRYVAIRPHSGEHVALSFLPWINAPQTSHLRVIGFRAPAMFFLAVSICRCRSSPLRWKDSGVRACAAAVGLRASSKCNRDHRVIRVELAGSGVFVTAF